MTDFSRNHHIFRTYGTTALSAPPSVLLFVILMLTLSACGDVSVNPLHSFTPAASNSPGSTSEEITEAAPITTPTPAANAPTPTFGGSTTPTATAAVSPTATSRADPPTTGEPAIPAQLVGTWNGGPDPGEFWLTLTSDARYELSNARYGYSDKGVVTLEATSITFTSDITGQRVIRQWMLQSSPDLYGYTFLILTLDGYSYVKES